MIYKYHPHYAWFQDLNYFNYDFTITSFFSNKYLILIFPHSKQDDDDDLEYADDDMKDLLEKLGPEAKRRVLMGNDESEDSQANESESEEAGWGKKKSTYWSADTADLEIGQDSQDADDEEIAAKVI